MSQPLSAWQLCTGACNNQTRLRGKCDASANSGFPATSTSTTMPSKTANGAAPTSRSARRKSAAPESTAAPKTNGTKRAAPDTGSDAENSKPAKRGKRAESPEPPKRPRGRPPKHPKGSGITSSKSAPALSGASKQASTVQINEIPQPEEHVRPARQVFMFGTGDMGQFGLGTDLLGEIARPRLHVWFEESVKSGALGDGPGAGVEKIAAGGMHTLSLDELGRVSPFSQWFGNFFLTWIASGLVLGSQ